MRTFVPQLYRMKQVTHVYLREKPISKNRQSLYLDFYPPIKNPDTGQLTRREFLGLTIFNEFVYQEEEYLDAKGRPRTRLVKVVDKQGKPKRPTLTAHQKTLNDNAVRLAKDVQAQRQVSLQDEAYGFLSDKRRNTDFIEFFDKMADERTGSSLMCWKSALTHLKAFAGATLKMSELTEDKCDEFKSYLLKRAGLSQNSAFLYLSKFRAALKEAYRKKILADDLTIRTKGIGVKEVEKSYLSDEELQRTFKAHCAIPQLKAAALFSAITGLRFSDIQKLTWSEVHYSKAEGHFLQFTQKKTKGVETLPFPPEAIKIIGDKREPSERVFPDLIFNGSTGKILGDWMTAAKVGKHITFHCFRHTYAVRSLSEGTDLFHLSKMMGHKDITTTQVYTKIVDKSKRQAADRIVGKLDFSELNLK
jgi:integrase